MAVVLLVDRVFGVIAVLVKAMVHEMRAVPLTTIAEIHAIVMADVVVRMEVNRLIHNVPIAINAFLGTVALRKVKDLLVHAVLPIMIVKIHATMMVDALNQMAPANPHSVVITCRRGNIDFLKIKNT